jgi:hypothetical protein
MPSEKQLDQALHAALEGNTAFRAGLVDQHGVEDGCERLVFCCSNHPWGQVRLIIPNADTAALEPVSREGADVLAVFKNGTGQRLSVHIENRLAAGAFIPYQAKVMAARAELGMGHERFGRHQIWKSVLVAPQSFIDRNGLGARKFMAGITHEQISKFQPAFESASV